MPTPLNPPHGAGWEIPPIHRPAWQIAEPRPQLHPVEIRRDPTLQQTIIMIIPVTIVIIHCHWHCHCLGNFQHPNHFHPWRRSQNCSWIQCQLIQLWKLCITCCIQLKWISHPNIQQNTDDYQHSSMSSTFSISFMSVIILCQLSPLSVFFISTTTKPSEAQWH